MHEADTWIPDAAQILDLVRRQYQVLANILIRAFFVQLLLLTMGYGPEDFFPQTGKLQRDSVECPISI